MSHPHGWANVFLASTMVSLPWWIGVFEGTSWFAAKIVPILGVLVGVLQLYFLFRKFIRK